MKKKEFNNKKAKVGKGNQFFYDSRSCHWNQNGNDSSPQQESFNYDDLDLSEEREVRRRLKRMRYDLTHRRTGEY